MPARRSHHATGWKWVLRRADQVAVAVLVCAGLAMIALYGLRHVGQRNRLIEIDAASRAPPSFIVDINEADWPELTQIPEIGETLARRIVDHRREHGHFRDLDDLTNVSGIGPRTLERIRPFLLPIPDRDMVAGP
jgi:competence protein ComEA